MIRFGSVTRQCGIGQYCTDKQPRSGVARHQIGMLALPASASLCGQRLFHQRRGINKHFDIGCGARRKLSGQLL